MPDSINRDLESAVISSLTRRLLPFLFLLYIVAYLDRINVGFAALQMQQQLHFTDAVYGLGAGMFFAGYFLFQVPSNLVLSRIGARRWISVLMIAWGAISSGMVLVKTPAGFYTLRFLLGLAEAGFFPGIILYLKAWFPAQARARTVARFMTAAPLSGVVGGPLSGALLGLHGVGYFAGWQWMFLLEGVPAIVLGIFVYFYLTDFPSNAHWLSAERREWLIKTLAAEQTSHPHARANFLAAFSNPAVWLLGLIYFGLNTVSYGVSLWLPNLIHSISGVSTFLIGIISAIPYVTAAIVMVLVGLHSDRTGERRWHLAAPAFIGAFALLLAAYSTSLIAMIASISLALVGVFSMVGPFWVTPTTLLAGTAGAAGIAFINSVGNLGGFFGPYIIGLVRTSTGNFKEGLLVVGATLTVSGYLALLVGVHKK